MTFEIRPNFRNLKVEIGNVSLMATCLMFFRSYTKINDSRQASILGRLTDTTNLNSEIKMSLAAHEVCLSQSLLSLKIKNEFIAEVTLHLELAVYFWYLCRSTRPEAVHLKNTLNLLYCIIMGNNKPNA